MVRAATTADAMNRWFGFMRASFARLDSLIGDEPVSRSCESNETMHRSGEQDTTAAGRPPRPWQRLSVRLAGLFAVVTLLAVGAVGLFTYQRQQREVQDTVGTQLLNIARVAALLVAT